MTSQVAQQLDLGSALTRLDARALAAAEEQEEFPPPLLDADLDTLGSYDDDDDDNDDDGDQDDTDYVEDDDGRDCSETGSVKSAMPRGEAFVSRECVEQLMREQDAELLESIHSGGPNACSGSTPILTSMQSSPSHLRSLSRLSLLVASQEDMQAIENAVVENSPVPSVKRRNRISVLDGVASEKLDLTEKSLYGDSDMVRRALSGEIWIQQDLDNAETKEDPLLITDLETLTSVIKGVEAIADNQEEVVKRLRRTDSMDRRMNEAAQFAEAVGELQLTDQEELRIIEEEVDDDDDDDDDNATEIHVQRGKISLALNGMSEPGNKVVLDKVEVRKTKTRPQWPFGGRSSVKRIFLDKLPETGTAVQDYVYKGIQSNPPEIVTSGMSRGNYAQLHRKAWLEVSDKYHRYGKNLRLYYRHWESLGCPTNMFFDWLDSKGEAAGWPLPELEECPRSQLDSDTVLYIMNPDVTAGYAIKFVPDDLGRGRAVDVDGDPVRTGSDGWIFVLRDGVMYGAQKITSVSGQSKQRFHHSSFFGGKAVAAAGIFITDNDGILTRLYPHSGHYRPGEADMQRVLFYLHHQGVDLRTFEVDMQQILHVARDIEGAPQKENGGDGEDKAEKKKKVESLQLVAAVLAACFLAHKARFIGAGIFSKIHKIRKADVASVTEALELIDNNTCSENQ